MSKIIAICGKICSGKTFYANLLRKKENAIILSCDEITKIIFNNNLGTKHDFYSKKIQSYLLKKTIELLDNNCSVILDWGFWAKKDRSFLNNFFLKYNYKVEWYYIKIDDSDWQKNINERNSDIIKGINISDFFVDEGLITKFNNRWEQPTLNEDMITYYNKR